MLETTSAPSRKRLASPSAAHPGSLAHFSALYLSSCHSPPCIFSIKYLSHPLNVLAQLGVIELMKQR